MKRAKTRNWGPVKGDKQRALLLSHNSFYSSHVLCGDERSRIEYSDHWCVFYVWCVLNVWCVLYVWCVQCVFFWCDIAVKKYFFHLNMYSTFSFGVRLRSKILLCFYHIFFWFDIGVKNSSFIWTTFTERVCHFFFWCKIVVKILLSFERFYHPLMWRLATWPIALEHGAADKATKNFFYEETVPIDSLIKIHILLQNVEL